MKIIPYMVERHEDNGKSTKQVNGFNSWQFCSNGIHVFYLMQLPITLQVLLYRTYLFSLPCCR